MLLSTFFLLVFCESEIFFRPFFALPGKKTPRRDGGAL